MDCTGDKDGKKGGKDGEEVVVKPKRIKGAKYNIFGEPIDLDRKKKDEAKMKPERIDLM